MSEVNFKLVSTKLSQEILNIQELCFLALQIYYRHEVCTLTELEELCTQLTAEWKRTVEEEEEGDRLEEEEESGTEEDSTLR